MDNNIHTRLGTATFIPMHGGAKELVFHDIEISTPLEPLTKMSKNPRLWLQNQQIIIDSMCVDTTTCYSLDPNEQYSVKLSVWERRGDGYDYPVTFTLAPCAVKPGICCNSGDGECYVCGTEITILNAKGVTYEQIMESSIYRKGPAS